MASDPKPLRVLYNIMDFVFVFGIYFNIYDFNNEKGKKVRAFSAFKYFFHMFHIKSMLS